MTRIRPAFLLALAVLAACASPPRGTVAPAPQPDPVSATGSAPRDVPEFGRVVVESARTFLGAPYRYGGDDTGGIDCSGLVVRSFGAAGVSMPRTAAAQAAAGYHVGRPDLRAGDLVLFAGSGGSVGHVGIWIGGGRFIHASSSRGVVVEQLATRWFADRFVGGRRVLRR
ncbi:MAG TPA: C40 family peptidase [Candidatus Krumholzibacteria bacterium]|nr:C40 family peptidase [Candidatus Krumholzibacteria bacterium]